MPLESTALNSASRPSVVRDSCSNSCTGGSAVPGTLEIAEGARYRASSKALGQRSAGILEAPFLPHLAVRNAHASTSRAL